MSIVSVYDGLCANCGGRVSEERLLKGLPCESCLAEEVEGGPEAIGEALERAGRLEGYSWIYSLEREYKDFSRFFESRTGKRLWSAQRSWARRLLLLESFSITAPTGVGKSTLLVAYAAYRALRDGWKVLYLVPTENLVRQVSKGLQAFISEGVLSYYSSMPRGIREKSLEALGSCSFRILVVTTGLLQRRFSRLASCGPLDLVIVDDVDSLLRNSRNIDRVLVLIGFPQRAVETAMRMVEAKLRLYANLASSGGDRLGVLEERVLDLERRLRSMTPSSVGQLVIASATGRPRGVKHLVFKELLGFEVGGSTDYLRNVIDSYMVSEDPVEGVLRVVKSVGAGGIIYVSQAYGRPVARLVAERLRREGFRVYEAFSGSGRAVRLLEEGRVDVLVGMASRYGVLVRGVDSPRAVRYAVFLGAPARRARLEDALKNPRRLVRLLIHASERGLEGASDRAERVKRILHRVGDPAPIIYALSGKYNPSGALGEAVEEVRESIGLVTTWFKAVLRGPERVGGMVITREGGELHVYLADALTYIQASGRTSRLLEGRMTLGLSVVVDRAEVFIESLAERLSWVWKANFRDFAELDLGRVLEDIESSRRGRGRKVDVKSVLLVVESPTKAKTISRFWGRPSKRRSGRVMVYETSTVDPEDGKVYLLTVASTRGHLFDLAVGEEGTIDGVGLGNGVYTPVYTSVKRCNSCGVQHASRGACPRCGSSLSRDSIVSVGVLRKLALEVDEIVIATDPDVEGEKIAWDVYLALKPYNPNIFRGRFHEVTPRALLGALRGAGSFNRRMIYSQIVRRVVDRWIGFGLSRALWARFKKRWLGAGRVQTPVLGWVIDRYGYWQATRGCKAHLALEGGGRVSFYSTDPDKCRRVAGADSLIVEHVSRVAEESMPPPPHTTDSLLYEASATLRISSRTAMKVAQELFEAGLITYHRTDSTRVAPEGFRVAKEYAELKGLTGLLQYRSWGAGGAHESIRPTMPVDPSELEKLVFEGSLRIPIKLTGLHKSLYELIFRRFMASQMKPSEVTKTRVVFRVGGERILYESIESASDEGYTVVYRPRVDGWLSNLRPGTRVRVEGSRITKASLIRLYRAGDLVKLMKENGIGRPSTYSTAIEANRRHGYIVESKRNKFIVPTKMGLEAYSYLAEHYKPLITVEASRRLEKWIEEVETGANPSEVLSRALAYIREFIPLPWEPEPAQKALAKPLNLTSSPP